MYEVAKALQYIDDDLLIDALNTVGANKKAPNNVKSVRWKSPAKGKGGVKTKVIAITSCILAVIVAVSIWAAVVLTGSEAIDRTRIGDEIIFDSFDTVSDIYPDEEMAGRLSIFDNLLRDIDDKNGYENYDVSLYYNEGTDWQDSDNWYSLIFSGYTGVDYILSEGDVALQYIMLTCLFSVTLDEFFPSEKNNEKVIIGATKVYIRSNVTYNNGSVKIVTGMFAFFEKNGIVYRIYINSGYPKEELNPTEEQMIEYLELLLAD